MINSITNHSSLSSSLCDDSGVVADGGDLQRLLLFSEKALVSCDFAISAAIAAAAATAATLLCLSLFFGTALCSPSWDDSIADVPAVDGLPCLLFFFGAAFSSSP